MSARASIHSKPLTAPRRVQLSRRKGWRKPANTVVVSRPSMWGNPFHVTKAAQDHYAHRPDEQMADAMQGVTTTPEAAVNAFRRYLEETAVGRFTCVAAKKALRGKNLACWCPPGQPCHADVLLEVANA